MNTATDAASSGRGAIAELPAPVRRMVGRLYRVFQAERVLLFGSYARGTPTPRSDIDLLAILPDDVRLEEATRRHGQLTAGLFPAVDLVLTTRRELAEARGERAAFLRSVLEHGIEQRGEPGGAP